MAIAIEVGKYNFIWELEDRGAKFCSILGALDYRAFLVSINKTKPLNAQILLEFLEYENYEVKVPKHDVLAYLNQKYPDNLKFQDIVNTYYKF